MVVNKTILHLIRAQSTWFTLKSSYLSPNKTKYFPLRQSEDRVKNSTLSRTHRQTDRQTEWLPGLPVEEAKKHFLRSLNMWPLSQYTTSILIDFYLSLPGPSQAWPETLPLKILWLVHRISVLLRLTWSLNLLGLGGFRTILWYQNITWKELSQGLKQSGFFGSDRSSGSHSVCLSVILLNFSLNLHDIMQQS